MVGIDVGYHGQTQEGVELRSVRDQQEIVHRTLEDRPHPLDDPLPTEVHQRFRVAAHAGALATRLDDARDLHSRTAPGRNTRGVAPVTSRTVEGRPPGLGPASSTRSSEPVK